MAEQKHVYAIQTVSGEEKTVSENISRLVPEEILLDRYIPMRETRRKIGGKYVQKAERLFPGYFFVETTDPDELFLSLKKVPHMAKILHDGEYTFYALNEDEIRFINKIGARRNDHTFGISQVVIDEAVRNLEEGTRVKVASGDLLDFEADVIKYDLHHRKAYVRTNFMSGTKMWVQVELLRRM